MKTGALQREFDAGVEAFFVLLTKCRCKLCGIRGLGGPTYELLTR